MRFELIPSAWKAENLPLIYIRFLKKYQNQKDSNLQSFVSKTNALPFGHDSKMSLVGFEPTAVPL